MPDIKGCKCGSAAVYMRKHEGRPYCGECFSGQIEKTLKQIIRENRLIKPGDKIAVALSGGKDSASLLHMLKKYEKAFHISLLAITVDEGIKGRCEHALAAAQNLTSQLDIEHHIFSFENEFGIRIDNIKERIHGSKINYCTYCGVLRRYLLNRKARELGANKLAVGINLDDEAESIFMNFLRGDFSQFQRLGANPIMIEDSKFAARIKPLRNIYETEIEFYAELNKIPFYKAKCVMPTSTIRWDVRDILDGLEKQRPGTKLQIVSFYDKLRPLIAKQSGKQLNYCKCGEPTSQEVCRACELLKSIKK
ncbi:MAG: TIGR00269 family protein [Candidatus Aenigmarchaeota archaeon]|nr:TIGR00269 family protein [Candidatus Aenigmarchaeota archaeon]